jgi:CTP:molybdopterin cytidylyltransferase MocA
VLGHEVEVAVIVLGDQPSVTHELIRRAVTEWSAAGAPVLRPLFRGVPGHPVVAGRAAWDAFMGASGDAGARGVLADIEVAEVEFGMDPLADIDTWDDYRAARNP